MMRYLQIWILALLVTALTACGGGGNPGATTTPTNPTVSQPSIALSLVDGTGSVLAANSISKSGAYYAKAVVSSASGTVLSNQLITFSTDNTIATLAGNAANATALTDSNGSAKVLISPLSLTTTGAAALLVVTSVNGFTLTKSLNFSTTPSNVTLVTMAASPSTIGALETAAVTVVGAVNGVPTPGVPVSFTASCAGTFSPSSAVTNGNGLASSTFQSVASCGGNSVTLSASATGAATVFTTIVVTAAKAANIVFSAATPSLMYASSAASGAKISAVKFQVLNSSAAGMPSQSVSMSLSNAAIAAGVRFSLSGSLSSAPQTVTTDTTGYASINVAAGTLPTTVSVTATLVSDNTVFASSLGLVVTTGAATQNAASLSASKLSIEAWNIDGVTTSLTMRVSDRLSNPVPDGTSVNFVASAGLITGSCVTANSACSVTYTSQGTRPANGRVAILAYLDGEESFIDLQGDNIWQPGETFYDVGKAYIDVNEDGNWVSGEQIIDTSTSSTACVNSTNTYPSIAGTCDGTWSSAIRVRKEVIITLATSDASIVGVTRNSSGFSVGISRTRTGFTVWVHDTNANSPYAPFGATSTTLRGTVFGSPGLYNAMPTGSTVSAAITSANPTCTIVAVSPNIVTNSPNGDLHDIVLSGDADCTTVAVAITVKTPNTPAVFTTTSF